MKTVHKGFISSGRIRYVISPTRSRLALLPVEKHARMTHEEENWRLSLTQPSGYNPDNINERMS